MKIPTSIWKWQNKRLSIMKIIVLLWSTSVENIVALSLFFSFCWAFLFLGLSFSFFLWDNALIMMIITLILIYNSILQLDTRTKYDSIWIPPAVYRDVKWIKSDMYEKLCMVVLPQIRCQLHDHAWQYDNMKLVIWTEVESCMAIYLGMAMEMPRKVDMVAVLRKVYGGCFEEVI